MTPSLRFTVTTVPSGMFSPESERAVQAMPATTTTPAGARLSTAWVMTPSRPMTRSALVGTRWGSTYFLARGLTTAMVTADTTTNSRIWIQMSLVKMVASNAARAPAANQMDTRAMVAASATAKKRSSASHTALGIQSISSAPFCVDVSQGLFHPSKP